MLQYLVTAEKFEVLDHTFNLVGAKAPQNRFRIIFDPHTAQ